ncbi:MAG: aspartate ammonia-lyase [Thermoplasmata archaeon]|nr:MAG: aspartate ammonia-lyase [Thermoplasmata archaeon]
MTDPRPTRVERDSLGEVEIPADALYGPQTARALINFTVTGLRAHPRFVEAYVLIKKAAAMANSDLGELDAERAGHIIAAADEVLSGEHREHFVVDPINAGAGTSFNMNTNEVLANRALQLMGREPGDLEALSPNDHVNMAQSTNDTFPTAMHLSVLLLHPELDAAVAELEAALKAKGQEFAGVVKSGRTHLQDAVPTTLGNEFTAYGVALEKVRRRLAVLRDDLLELPLGGTAVGTGTNAHPQYKERAIGYLASMTGLDLRPAQDLREIMQSRQGIAAYSGGLRALAIELTRIANDLRLLGSGPTSGLAEVRLPPVQPGSSIMPGKVNPVMSEALNMLCFQVMGNDHAVAMAAQAGQMELNVMMPGMIHAVLQSMQYLVNYLPTFTERGIRGIEANVERATETVSRNPAIATLLAPTIGYLEAAALAKEAVEANVPVLDLALEKGMIDEAERRRVMDELGIED